MISTLKISTITKRFPYRRFWSYAKNGSIVHTKISTAFVNDSIEMAITILFSFIWLKLLFILDISTKQPIFLAHSSEASILDNKRKNISMGIACIVAMCLLQGSRIVEICQWWNMPCPFRTFHIWKILKFRFVWLSIVRILSFSVCKDIIFIYHILNILCEQILMIMFPFDGFSIIYYACTMCFFLFLFGLYQFLPSGQEHWKHLKQFYFQFQTNFWQFWLVQRFEVLFQTVQRMSRPVKK